ncbi:MAG: polymer-forming cytoskeletal protein [Chitinophagales bacterium]|nr:polymer-forming cytoskeletal protein [Chitinophagales bacterium]
MNQKSTDAGDLGVINLVGKGTEIIGNLVCNGDIRIDGSLKGNIKTPHKIVTGPSSEIIGDIQIGSGIIGGIVRGNIYSTGTLEIEKTASLEGIIESNGLIIHEGADLRAEINSKNKTLPKSLENQNKKVTDFSRAAVL